MNPTDYRSAYLENNPMLNDYAKAQATAAIQSDLTWPPMSHEEAIAQYRILERQSRQRQTSQGNQLEMLSSE